MKDLFKIAMNKDIGVGGYHCYCCCPLPSRGGKRHRKAKIALHKAARSRMKMELKNGNNI